MNMATYALSDIHGQGDLLDEVLNFLKEDDVLYFLGDACDRGNDNLYCMQTLLKDKRVIYLKGNHEDFFRIIISQILNDDFSNVQHWAQNGGRLTMEEGLSLPYKDLINLLYDIDKLPLVETYINQYGQKILLSHAGFTPDWLWNNTTSEKDKKWNYIWDRQHIKDINWDGSNGTEEVIIVHGHTPVQHLSIEGVKELEKNAFPVCYSKGHKFDIDLGAFYTEETCLLNLDDFSTIKFKREKSKEISITKVDSVKTEIIIPEFTYSWEV